MRQLLIALLAWIITQKVHLMLQLLQHYAAVPCPMALRHRTSSVAIQGRTAESLARFKYEFLKMYSLI